MKGRGSPKKAKKKDPQKGERLKEQKAHNRRRRSWIVAAFTGGVDHANKVVGDAKDIL